MFDAAENGDSLRFSLPSMLGLVKTSIDMGSQASLEVSCVGRMGQPKNRKSHSWQSRVIESGAKVMFQGNHFDYFVRDSSTAESTKMVEKLAAN